MEPLITPPLFQYFLTYEGERTEVPFAPISWEDESYGQYKRDLKYFGLIRSLTFPLRFPLTGKDILRRAWAKYGVEAGVRLEINIRQNDWTYQTKFLTDLDFSTYNYVGDSVEIQALEGGVTKEIKSNENIKFEYPLSGDDVVNIVIPGIKFNDYAIFVPRYTDTTDLNANKRFTVGMDQTTPFQSNFVEGRNTLQRPAADSDNFSGDIFVLGTRPEGTQVTIKGYVAGETFFPPPFDPTILRLLIKSTNGATIRELYAIDPLTGRHPYSATFDFTYTLSQGEGLYLYSRPDSDGKDSYLSVNEGEFRISYAAKSDPSNCKGFTANTLYKKILNRISPTLIPNSSLLTDRWATLIFTSGNAIRELENPTIKISWSDFFETFDGIDDAGFGIQAGQARLENKPFFARLAKIVDLGNVNSCSIAPATDFMFKKVTIGYDDGNTDDVDGLEEYNSKQEYSLPFSVIDTERSFISPTRADQFGIEQVRVKYNIKNRGTTDNRSDNDTFMIYCNPIVDGNYTPELGGQYSSVTGLTFPLTAYNLRLSPKQSLLRKSAYLRSILDKQDGRFIQYASAEKNAEVQTVIDGNSVKENSNVSVASLSGKFFIPQIATISPQYPVDALNIVDNTPFGYMSFDFNDENYYGYLFDIKIDLATNAEQELKLLLLEMPAVEPPVIIPEPEVYGNDLLTLEFTKNDCPTFNGSTVIFQVPANMFTGPNKENANLQAQEYASSNGQSFANTNGTCGAVYKDYVLAQYLRALRISGPTIAEGLTINVTYQLTQGGSTFPAQNISLSISPGGTSAQTASIANMDGVITINSFTFMPYYSSGSVVRVNGQTGIIPIEEE